MTEHPYPATVLVLDIRGFGKLTNPEQIEARRQLYAVLTDAFLESGLDWDQCTHEDRGDGALVIVPIEIPKVVLLDPVLTALATRVETAPRLGSGWSMRLRVAVHTGEVHNDDNGFVGADVNFAFRLLDSDVLRDALATTERRCAVLVSDVLYQGVVRHGYGRLDPAAFHHTVLHTKEMTSGAWLSVPGDDTTARAVAGRRRDHPESNGGFHVGGDLTATGSNIAGRDLSIGDTVHGDHIENATFLQQVRTYSAKHPVVTFLLVMLLIALLGGGGYAVYVAAHEQAPTNADTSTTGDQTTPVAAGDQTAETPDAPAPAAGLRDPSILVGSWQSADNTIRTFSGSGGACAGFFYSNGQILDIGGPMSCVLSSQPDDAGRFTLVVTQSPNQANYRVLIESTDQVSVFDTGGDLLYRLTRF